MLKSEILDVPSIIMKKDCAQLLLDVCNILRLNSFRKKDILIRLILGV